MSANIFSSLNSDDNSSCSSNEGSVTKNKGKKKNIISKKVSNKEVKISKSFDFAEQAQESLNSILQENVEKEKYKNIDNSEDNIKNSENNPFEVSYSKKTYKKIVNTNNNKSVSDKYVFLNISEKKTIENLKFDNHYQTYAHFNGDKNWRYANYLPISKLESWKDIAGFLNSLDKRDTRYTMNDFDIFVMKNNISPMWEDEQNKDGSIISIKLASNEDAFKLFKFLLINICNSSLLKYTEKTHNKTNGITFSTKFVESANLKSYIVKVWFKYNFCGNNYNYNFQSIFNNHINDELEGYSVKFRPIKPEF